MAFAEARRVPTTVASHHLQPIRGLVHDQAAGGGAAFEEAPGDGVAL